MKAHVTSKGQVTIPIEIRRRLNIRPGTELIFDEKAPFVKATKQIDESRMRSVLGCLKDENLSTSEEILDDLRGKVDLP